MGGMVLSRFPRQPAIVIPESPRVVANNSKSSFIATGRGARSGRGSVIQHDTDIVNALRLAIAQRVGQDRFELWFRGAQVTLDGSTVRIATGTTFTLGRMRNSLRPDIEAACQTVLGSDVQVEFRVASMAGDEVPAGAQSSAAPTVLSTLPGENHEASSTPSIPVTKTARPSGSSGGRRKFAELVTFLGVATNRVAISAAVMVAKNLGSVTPLFLYGSTGLGKSHLAQGIWCRVRRHQRCFC